jgi:hypothetical protein
MATVLSQFSNDQGSFLAIKITTFGTHHNQLLIIPSA